jgi:hypothetical protein
MSQRTKYWSCSAFADRLRGVEKSGAKTAEGWRDWKMYAKGKHPFRYWLAEEGLDKIQNFLWWPIDRIHGVKYYINNRFISKTHSLTAHPRDIKPGRWCDVGNRFLPCLFNELVDFVEVELAWWHLVWDKDERKKYNAPWWRFGWWNMRLWRCPQAGLDNLEWQRNLVWTENECEPGSSNIGEPTYQAIKAQEILALYKWWTEIYPNRPDPHDASGWSEYCRRLREENGKENFFCETKDPELRKFGDEASKKTQEIEEAYQREDEEMLIRLIRIRNSLWT